jgi:hypothetical protein
MSKSKKKSGEKIVFIVVIAIFVFSSVLAYSSVALKPPAANPVTPSDNSAANDFQNNKKITTDQLNDLIKKSTPQQQSLEGIVTKMEPGTYSEGGYLLQASGVTLAVLENGDGVNLDKYIDKNVSVSGTSRMIAEGDGVIMKVTNVEVK